MAIDLELKVGQVIYLCSRKETRVYPVLVTEKIEKNTLDGKFVSYVVRLPTRDAKEASLESIDAEIFLSVKQARDEMVSKANSQIEKILENAKSLSLNAFGSYEADTSNDSDSEESFSDTSEEEILAEDFALVDLGDGKVAKINLDTIRNPGEEK